MGAARTHVVVLAAGRGRRLGAVSETTPKWLLEVGTGTIADRHLEAVGTSSALVVTGHARATIERFLEMRNHPATVVHNPEYARLNNWYSLLVGLRALELQEDDRVVVLNADLFAEPDWIAAFLEDSATTAAQSLIAVDVERALTDESMKVSVRPAVTGGMDLLDGIGKVGVADPVGEYVGMLMARGEALAALRRTLESFLDRPDAADEWYERAVWLSAREGVPWHVWPTPSSEWVEIDDDGDYESARELCAS